MDDEETDVLLVVVEAFERQKKELQEARLLPGVFVFAVHHTAKLPVQSGVPHVHHGS
ncbi:hypothetical protein F443_05905 [Phytophthora nicotianae P1569]|uniref:Uncharacterized protein n=1 Tax=Phytophthora nicotianae P1569 TaxID=1317065 RepID=V9FGH7_PHYNI|nr:hypothetical protein F443_05905 [Phytophthora nicotianae P1569]